ncbi:hypothetical protein Lepto7375DRAFT_7634 [Leptolyngbya sp. PCC 7375]|nr:hypothetical protein Lepto7375DRAFT_7634 [Leptolyngbya sp. PCC 7375]
MSVTVLPQLVEAESLLSSQEAALMQQLAEIQEQRKGLQTVIAMFDSSADNGQLAAVVAPVIKEAIASTKTKAAEETVAAKLARVTKSKIAADEPKPTKARQTSTVKKSAPTKKADGRSARWQRYVLEKYRQQRLPDVVTDVLKTEPKDSFKITDVMLSIFEEDMPKPQYLKARSRVSNILSAGARDGDWYRGRGGTYSLSKKAVKTR